MTNYLDIDNMSSDYVLESVYEIEDLLSAIKDIDDKLEWYKGVKEHRVRQIDAAINELRTRSARLRDVVLRTMQRHEPSKKTLPFPGIGKVTRRQTKPDYQIADEDAMLSFFDAKGVKDQVVKTKVVVDTREAKRLVADFDAMNQAVPGVQKVDAKESLSVSFENKDKPPARNKPVSKPAATKTDMVELQELNL